MSATAFISKRFFHTRRNDRFLSRITLIAIVGIMLGTAALIVTLSVLGGFEKEISEKVIGFSSHIQVRGFQNQPLMNPEISVRLVRDSVHLVEEIVPFVAREAIIRSPEGVDGILLKGVPPEADVIRTKTYLVEGSYSLESVEEGLPRLLIGKTLARRLSLRIGDRAAVFGLSGPVRRAQNTVLQFMISGIYESGMAEYDDVMAFTDLASAQQFLRLDGRVTGYDVLVHDIDSAKVASDRIDRILGYPHYSLTVFESHRNIFSWIELQKQPVPIIIGAISLVATVNMIGTLLMIVFGKIREIGILLSLGMTRRAISGIFLRQGFMIALVGTILGNVLGFGLCFVQLEFDVLSLPSNIYFMSSVPILLRWEYFVIVSSVSILLSLIFSAVPSWFASRVDPVRAIRFS